jgi:ATP-dependent DNA helicase DinG
MTVTSFEEAQEVFAAKLQGYTRRAHQIALAEQVEQAIADGKHALFQAGTGTGKSFALLIPAIISRLRTVVATFNKALQNQYIRDLMFLAANLGIDFRWALLKGRGNYPCLAKINDLGDAGRMALTTAQRAVIERVETDLAAKEETVKIADREDFPLLTDEAWKPFSMSAGECPGASSCPFGDKCLTEAAKARAAAADIVVTNTAYLVQDLILRKQTEGNVALLGDFDRLIIDEAHTLGDVTTGALAETMGEGTFRALARDMAGYMDREGGDVMTADKIEQAAQALWTVLGWRFNDFAEKSRTRRNPMPLTVSMLINEEDLGGLIRELYQVIERAREEIKATRPDFDDIGEKIRRERLLRRSYGMLLRIMAFATDDPEQTIRWAEAETVTRRGEQREYLYLRSSPVSVAQFLRAALWDRVPVIMSSATLASGGNFSHLMETLGLNKDEAMTYDAGSPFDYPRQVTLYVPDKNVPDPRDSLPAWRTWAQTVTHHLVSKAGGGALLLFTSRAAMNESYSAIAARLQAEGLTVLKQGDMPSSELIRIMREDGNAVLFALRTFFEGVDIQGHALRLVVLDKLPFAVPSDLVFQARVEALDRKHGPWAGFNRLTIPSMILILNQAFGRLIRHADDHGVVAILDPRLRTKRYGATIMRAMPPATATDQLEDAVAFLEAIRQPVG